MPLFLKRSLKAGLFGAVIALYVWLIFTATHPSFPSAERPLLIYSNQCHDDLKHISALALKNAKSSIHMASYAVTDPDILKILLQKAHSGIETTLLYDPSASPNLKKKLYPYIKASPVSCKGLMHRKILIIDDTYVYLGSANMTTSSLKMHDNLVFGMCHPGLCSFLKQNLNDPAPKHFYPFTLGDQAAELWLLPDFHDKAINRLLALIEGAQKTVHLAMFTLTHPALTQALIKKHKEGVEVSLAVDFYTGQGASQKTLEYLRSQGLKIYLSQGGRLLHYKWAFIDEKTFIAGSTNWTRAAFKKNQDCFVILQNLNQEQKNQIKKIWKTISLESI